MKTFLALLRAEILLHRRSLRSRLVLAIYPLMCLAPSLFDPILTELTSGPATALSRLVLMQPLAALLLAFGLCGRAADRNSREELLPLLVGSRFRSSEFVFGRAFIQSFFFLLYTAVPHLVLAISFLGRGWPVDPLALLDAWLFWAWPMTTILGWTFLALVIVGGSDLAAILLLFVGALLQGQLRGLLGGFETTFGWPFLSGAAGQIQTLFELVAARQEARVGVALIATEGPIDLLTALERRATDLLPALGLAVLLLSVSAMRLGRYRADLPARSFTWAPSLGRLRQSLKADAGLGWEKALVAVGLATAALGLYYSEQRARAFFAWGQERFKAEMATQAEQITATDPALELLGIHLRVDLGRSANLPTGHLEGEFEALYEKRGDSADGAGQRLAFRLNPLLTIDDLQALAGDTVLPARHERLHDRLFLQLERSLRPGEKLIVKGRLRGRPASPWLKFKPGLATHSFGESWAQLMLTPLARAQVRLAAGEWRPAISRNQVRLEAEDLFPVPRYTPFRAASSPTQAMDDSRVEADPTPPESSLGEVPIALEIAIPAGWELFTSCAQKKASEQGRSWLRGTCRTRPVDFSVRGGAFEVFDRGAVALATLPLHAQAAQPLLESLEQIHARSALAWPGLPPLGDVVLLEKLPYLDVLAPRHKYYFQEPPILVYGQLLEIDERRLLSPRYLDPYELIEPLVVSRLLRQRRLDIQESWAIGAFLREVVSRRLGLGAERGGALLGGPEWTRAGFSLQIHAYQYFENQQGRRRMAALVADLEGRVGSGAIQQGIHDFLDKPGEEPGKLAELIAAIDARSEESLGNFHSEFFEKGALPRLELTGIEVRPLGAAGFGVAGELKNKSRGEVICPIVVQTDRGELSYEVRVGGESATPFLIKTPQRPRMVELDPRHTCLRFATTSEQALERVQL